MSRLSIPLASLGSLWIAALPASSSCAQERSLDPVVVSASRIEQRLFDTPAAVDRIDTDWRNTAALGISLAEPLTAVPGVTIRERQNFAQDVQLSIRGFGSRATFGIRGSRILVDGIPASMPDGQGQLSTASLAAVDHVEVLRGPWAQMYGNAGGGVLLVETRPAPEQPEAALRLAAGSDGFRQAMASAGGRLRPGLGLQAAASDFTTDGAREHASARRRYLDLRMDWQGKADTSVRAGINVFSQPKGEDPLGLTRDEFERDRRAVNPLALQFNTRKTVDQVQAGVQVQHRLNPLDRLAATAYAGRRDLRQFLAFSGAAPTSAGGVIDLERDYYGAGLAWHRRFRSEDAIPLRWSVGAEIEAMRDRRLGFVNLNGSAGDLRRNEDDDATAAGIYGQLAAYVQPQVLLSAGARYSRVRISVDDRYVTATSPDDSGSVRFNRFSPVLGVLWHAREWLNLFANAGYGFETPTFTELAYRPGGTGLNFELQPARSRHLEAGAKIKRGDAVLQATLFHSKTDDDIVPLSNQGGRATFRNVDGVERYGLELGAEKRWHTADLRLAYTLLQARFTQAFLSADGRLVEDGNRLPGTSRHVLSLEAGWRPREDTRLGAVLYAQSRMQADDLNTTAAPGYATLGLHANRSWRIHGHEVGLFARIDNLLDRRYSGSVIVNENNRRYFEPGQDRSFTAGVRLVW